MFTATQLDSTDSKTPAEHAAKTMGDYVNSYSHDSKEFVEAMSRQHRTLQQSFTGVCVAWLHHLSKLEEFRYDGRNEASVQLAKKLLAERPDFDPKYDLYLPLV